MKDANAYIPSARTIIICLDGTGDKFDNDNSNIVHLVGCLKKDDANQVTVSLLPKSRVARNRAM